MTTLDRILWSVCDWLASRTTTQAFAASMIAAVLVVGYLDGVR